MDETRPARVSSLPLDVALVCTANRARSPLAEASLRSLARPSLMVVRSAGIADFGAAGALAEAVAAAEWLRLDLSGHRSHALAPRELEGADVVVGFEHLHLRRAVVHGGAARERAFLLPQLVTLLEATPAGADRSPVARARQRLRLVARDRDGSPTTRAEEIPDPAGMPPRRVRAVAQEIHGLCERLVAALFG